MKLHIGIDIGSISVNTVLMNADKEIVKNKYTYCQGKPFHVLKEILQEIFDEYTKDQIGIIAFTGSGGKKASELVGGFFVNEIIAQSSSVAFLYPDVKTIIEMGGEDSKLIFMENREAAEKSNMCDFSMNSLCAAGTGSFLDQQAKRIGVSIENGFGEMALKSENPPRIAGRCSVFAKSDMIHLQQIATPVHDIVAGLCFAVARNFKSNLGKGKNIETPVIFQGGVSANKGMIRAFKEIFKLSNEDLIIPEYYASMGAIGAVYHIINEKDKQENPYKGIDELAKYLVTKGSNGSALEPLKLSEATYNKEINFNLNGHDKLEVYLGLDIGSLSTNVVLIDDKNNVVARRYLPTASKPLIAIRRGLEEIFEEVGDKVIVKAAGTTGSGRYLTGDFIGADVIQNEITAQATAAIAHDPTVDTIFEIGGQDSKYISIENGIVVDFEMNKVCAAGTGSFLEEQAEKLNINIIEEFGDLALNAKEPASLGDRCTVFIESDLNSNQQKGVTKDNLVGGLAYSIVYNYLQKVVGNRKVGNKIFFQGGVTNNKAVVAAFEKVTGKKITIPPHFDVTGAIGTAILARNEINKSGNQTRFKGFDISKIPYTVDKFTCKSCSNQCEIRRVRIEGESKALFYGGRCEKYEVEERKGKGKNIPNLFEERIKLLTGDFIEDDQKGEKTIGFPRALMVYFQQFPFWRTYFQNMGFKIVLSDPSDHHMVNKSHELLIAETCFPVQLMHGHVLNLLEKNVDFIFTPFIVNAKADKNNPTSNCNCPWVQSYSFMIKAALKNQKDIDKLLIPTLHFRYFGKVLNNELSGFMKEKFNISKSKSDKAIKLADEAQTLFENAVQEKGKEVLANLPDDKKSAVILGRPYNTGDPELNLRMVEKLINQNVMPIPIDFLPLNEENVFEDYNMMYWPNGQKIISAVKYIKKHPKLDAIFLGNFRCGPDTFLTHFVREEMKGKPYLHLEIDEHSADAGMITRFEAFLDSLRGSKKVKSEQEKIFRPGKVSASVIKDRVLYFPYMCDAAYAIAAAVRHFGTESYVLPMQNEHDIELGRKHTSSNECFPMICTLGSFLKKMEEPNINPKKISFFMPDHNGPCRFGQYNKLQKLVFNRLGYNNVQFVSPSNANAYEDISGGKGSKFTMLTWKASVAVDILKKMLQEKRPYELIPGETNRIYKICLDKVIDSTEKGGKDLTRVIKECADIFKLVQISNGYRKPLVPVLGEIFMRDNPFCSGNLVERLEKLGAETVMASFSEYLLYSAYRHIRDSKWKGDFKGIIKSKINWYVQNYTQHTLHKAVNNMIDTDTEISVEEMLTLCDPYVHKDYDGDPAVCLGEASALARKGVSGIIHILPFTCMPGTLIGAVSPKFRTDHNNIPWENIAYDGQDDTAIETRLQAFMHQVKEYAQLNSIKDTV
ncbi:MAG: CoA activase [Bacteroidales bacterium]|nr:CoA activase [Bacteroidales bacterium]